MTYVLARAVVAGVNQYCPSFVRVTFASAEFAQVGVQRPWFDQRIKLIFPSPGRRLPAMAAGDDWWQQWSALPEIERGSMRTYTVRAAHGDGADRTIDVDFVLHLEPGLTGPASRWAATAVPGDEVLIVAPKLGEEPGGAEFAPGSARRLLLAGDETAVPAIARILADVPRTVTGAAFLEVPTSDDIHDLDAPAGLDVTWLPRDGRVTWGDRLIPEVLAHFGSEPAPTAGPVGEDEVLWDTPTGPTDADLYAWIAGESAMVKTLRRHLVHDISLDREQVAFMGYWRRGVAMRS